MPCLVSAKSFCLWLSNYSVKSWLVPIYFLAILHAFEALMPHSDSGLARCVLVLTFSPSLTFCGLNVSTTACRAFTNRHHLHFLHCLFNSSLFQHHLNVNPCLYLRENMFWVLNVKTKPCYSVISCILYTRATKCHCRNRHSHYFLRLFETMEDSPLPVPLKPFKLCSQMHHFDLPSNHCPLFVFRSLCEYHPLCCLW